MPAPRIRTVVIGPMPRPLPVGMGDPMPKVSATFDDGSVRDLFEFYPDEIQFTEAEFIGLTEQEALQLRTRKDIAYLTDGKSPLEALAKRLAPLAPSPKWVHFPMGDWLDQRSGRRFDEPPAAYEAGFEEGAFALGRVAAELLHKNDTQALVALLLSYADGSAHPASGWQHEPKRS